MGTVDGEKLLAKLQIYGVDDMDKKQRKDIARWLKEQAKGIVREGKNYSTQFRAAYYWLK